MRVYDHRMREWVRDTGDLRIATGLGVPRSTAAGWLPAPAKYPPRQTPVGSGNTSSRTERAGFGQYRTCTVSFTVPPRNANTASSNEDLQVWLRNSGSSHSRSTASALGNDPASAHHRHMDASADLDAHARDPIGHYLVGRSWIHFAAHPTLFGIVFFGRPDRADVEALVEALRIELREGIAPHRSLVDARRLNGTDAGAFSTLHAYVRHHHGRLAISVERLALVRSQGIEGAVAAGFYGVLDPPYPVSVFEDLHPALASLGEPAALADELDRLVEKVASVHPSVTAVRAYISKHLARATLDGACKALGISTRTLQRRLREADTTFERQCMAARFESAKRMLRDTDQPLTVIAIDSGFASLQNFSTHFRKATGQSPSAWRVTHRRDRPALVRATPTPPSVR